MTTIKYWITGFCFILAASYINTTNAKQLLKDKQQSANQASWFKTDIEGIEETMLYPEFWKEKVPNPNLALLSKQQIQLQNSHLMQSNPYVNDLKAYPKSIDKKSLQQKILSISKKPTGARFYADGTQLTEQDFSHYYKQLNLEAIKSPHLIEYAMVVKRANMRSFPTHDRVFKTATDINLDRFQETALFPAEVVVVLHYSLDGQWAFVTSYNYSAWVSIDKIALGKKEALFNYHQAKNFLIITGDKVLTTFNPYQTNISEVQLDMGVKIKLTDLKKVPATIGGQNTYASFVVDLPTRDKYGQLKFEQALIRRNKDVHMGYLEYNRQNILNQSFKFLGERYGWGHSFNARDCTGFVGEVYKSFGILMPRNTGQQASSQQGNNIHFTKDTSVQEKIKQLQKLEVGDLIYIPGHVMMFLGLQNGKPYIIHDVSGLSYFKQNGEYYKSSLNGVSVTPLLPLQLNQESKYLDRIYNLKKIK